MFLTLSLIIGQFTLILLLTTQNWSGWTYIFCCQYVRLRHHMWVWRWHSLERARQYTLFFLSCLRTQHYIVKTNQLSLYITHIVRTWCAGSYIPHGIFVFFFKFYKKLKSIILLFTFKKYILISIYFIFLLHISHIIKMYNILIYKCGSIRIWHIILRLVYNNMTLLTNLASNSLKAWILTSMSQL
jgi:hypothetical protein